MNGVDIKSLGDVLASLNVSKAAALSTYLKDAYGIEPAAVPSIVRPTPTTPTQDAVRDEPSSFDVVLRAAGDKKIQVIKVVRLHTGLGLKEAKDLVEAVPAVVKTALPKDEAERLVKDLREQGATAELR